MEDSLYSSSPYKMHLHNTEVDKRSQLYQFDDDQYFSGASPHESSSISSTWTEILAGYSDYVKRLEQGNTGKYNQEEEDDDGLQLCDGDNCLRYSNWLQQDTSMVSDAGSGPEWRRLHEMGNHKHSKPVVSMGRKLMDVKNKRVVEVSCDYYDDSLEDTASSPVNSPKITMELKKMDLHVRRTNEMHARQ